MNPTKHFSFIRVLGLLLCLVSAGLNSLNAQLIFHEHAALPEPGRDDAVCFTIGEELYVTGGGGDGFFIQGDLWRYSPTNDSWLALSDFPGVPRQYAYAGTIGGKAYQVGGLTKTQESLNELWEYDPSMDQWTQRAPFPGAGRYKAVGFILGNSFFYGSGTNGVESFRDFWEYDPYSDQWSAIPPLPEQARHECFSFAYNGHAYVGGGIDSTGAHLKSMYRYDVNQMFWGKVTALPYTLAYAEGACAEGFCAIWDGLANGEFHEYLLLPSFTLSAFDASVEFSEISIPGIPVRNSSVCYTNDKIYRFGGKDSTGQKYSTLTSLTWEAQAHVRLFPNPAGTELHIACSELWSMVRIYDSLGKEVYSTRLDPLQYEYRLKLDVLLPTAGLYYILVDNLNPVRFLYSP